MVSRRDVLRVGISGAFLGATGVEALAQDVPVTPLSADDVESLHTQMVSAAVAAKVDNDILGQGSIMALLDGNELSEYLPEGDRGILGDVISKLFSSRQLDEFLAFVRGRYADFSARMGELAKYVLKVLISSAELAGELLREVDWEQVIPVIAADLRGALDGAIAGSNGRWGRYGTLLGAVCGAVSASTQSYGQKTS